MLREVFYSVNFRLVNKKFLTEFFIASEIYSYPKLKFRKIFHLLLFFLHLWAFENC